MSDLVETLKTDFLITRLNHNTCSYLEIGCIHKCLVFVCLGLGFSSKSTIFSHVGADPTIPRYYKYFLGGKCILLNDTTRRPELGSNPRSHAPDSDTLPLGHRAFLNINVSSSV